MPWASPLIPYMLQSIPAYAVRNLSQWKRNAGSYSAPLVVRNGAPARSQFRRRSRLEPAAAMLPVKPTRH